MNTFFKKGYFLAGVIMAANMFAVNEMKAMENNENNNIINNDDTKDNENEKEVKTVENNQQNQEAKLNNSNCKEEIKNLKSIKIGQKNKKKSGEQSFFGFLLSHENLINLIGGLALSGANNYFKWWDYNAGGYLNLRIGCIGWRSKRFLDIFQFDINLNGIRGISWSIPHIINLILIKGSKKGKKDGDFSWIGFFFKDILRGFTSMPLTLHFSNFSISISLDSIIWGIIGKILELKGKKDLEEIKKFNEGEELEELTDNIIDNPEINPKSPTDDNKQLIIDNKEKKEDKKKEEVKPNNMNNDPTKDKTTEEKKEETEKQNNEPKVEDNLE